MNKTYFYILAICLSSLAYAANSSSPKEPLPKKEAKSSTELATFAAGCFWCIQKPYDKLADKGIKGILKTTVGYAGGLEKTANYKAVSSGKTNHIEALQIEYDPKIISYEKILDIFWKNIDPFDEKGQFCDKGDQYRSAIYFHDSKQKNLATAYKEKLTSDKEFSKKGKIATLFLDYTTFFPAENYHQKYYDKKPGRYKFYRFSCGRDNRLKSVWGKGK